MDNILDIVNKEEYRPNLRRLRYFTSKNVINKMTNENLKNHMENFPDWIYISYNENYKLNKDMIEIPVKIFQRMICSYLCIHLPQISCYKSYMQQSK